MQIVDNATATQSWDFESTTTPTLVSNGIIKGGASSGTGWQRMTASETTIGAKSGSYAFCSTNSDYDIANKPYNPPASSTTTDDNTPAQNDAYKSSEAIVVFTVKPTSSDQILSFYYKGAGEINATSASDWDNFSFYINDEEKFNTRSANVEDWTSYISPKLTANQTYTIKFRYRKDGSTSRYWDRYCIDDLKLASPQAVGVNAIPVNANNYPGATISSFTSSEECDGNDNRTNLCNRWLTMNGKQTNTSYYENASYVPDCSETCKINNISDTNYTEACGYCGDGAKNGSEECGDETLYNMYGDSPTSTSGTAKAAGTSFTATNGYKYYINIPGIYCFETKGGDGNVGQSGNNGCSGAKVKGCYKLQKGDLVTFRVGSKGDTRPTDSSSVCKTYNGGGGGGGASWVYLTRNSTDTLLMVAGGGGGGGGGWDNKTSPDRRCNGGSDSTSSNNTTYSNGGTCSDNSASAGTGVDGNNFNSLTSAPGGDGGFHWTTKGCGFLWLDTCCNDKYACGGGGGGYAAGNAGARDSGGGGGGSYLNTSFTSYYSSGSYSPVAGSKEVSSPAAGSISVTNPNCLTCSNCKYTSTYGSCN